MKPARTQWSLVAIIVAAIVIAGVGVLVSVLWSPTYGFLIYAVALGMTASVPERQVEMGELTLWCALTTVSAIYAGSSGTWWIASVIAALGSFRAARTLSFAVAEGNMFLSERGVPETNDLLVGEGALYVACGVTDNELLADYLDEEGKRQTEKFLPGADLLLVGPAHGPSKKRFLRQITSYTLLQSGTVSHMTKAYLLDLVFSACIAGIALIVGLPAETTLIIAVAVFAAVALLLTMISAYIYMTVRKMFRDQIPDVKP